jgi:hypothetical protein
MWLHVYVCARENVFGGVEVKEKEKEWEMKGGSKMDMCELKKKKWTDDHTTRQ